MPHYAVEYGKRAVRGKVESASITCMADGTGAGAWDIAIEKIPYQTNNMDEWLAVICREIRPKQLAEIQRTGHWDRIEYIVNDGRGPLQGHAASLNKFTFKVVLPVGVAGSLKTFHKEFSIDLNIRTVGFSNLYHKRLRAEGKKAPYLERRDGLPSGEGFFVGDNEGEGEPETEHEQEQGFIDRGNYDA